MLPRYSGRRVLPPESVSRLCEVTTHTPTFSVPRPASTLGVLRRVGLESLLLLDCPTQVARGEKPLQTERARGGKGRED